MPVLIVRDERAAARDGVDERARREGEQAGVLPDVGLGVPVVLAPEAAVADDERRRVADVGRAPEREDVVVERGDGDGVLDAGVAVEDHVHVVVERGAALGDDHHLQVAGRREDLLALIAAGLVVALDRDGASGLHPAEVAVRVVQRVDRRAEVAVGAVEDRPRREDARADDLAGLDHLGEREDRLGRGRGVVRRRDAIGEVGVVDPVGLRDRAVEEVARVGVDVHEARHDGVAAGVDHLGLWRDAHLARGSDGGDPVAAHDDGAVLDHLIALHRDDAGIGERDSAFGRGERQRQPHARADACRAWGAPLARPPRRRRRRRGSGCRPRGR